MKLEDTSDSALESPQFSKENRSQRPIFNNQVALPFNLIKDYSVTSVVLLHVQQEMLTIAYNLPGHTSTKTRLVYYPKLLRLMYSV